MYVLMLCLYYFLCYHYFIFYYVSFTFMIFFLHSKKKQQQQTEEEKYQLMFPPCHVVRNIVYKESVLFSFIILYKKFLFLKYEIQKKNRIHKIKARYNKEIRNRSAPKNSNKQNRKH